MRPYLTLVAPRPRAPGEASCAFCKRAAVFLCDFLVDARAMQTCDLPLCQICVCLQERLFMCQTRKWREPGRCEVETIDYCPPHARKMRAT